VIVTQLRSWHRCRRLRQTTFLFATLCFCTLTEAVDIGGRWLTFDSSSGEKRSVVEIVYANGAFRGRILELFTQPGEPIDPVCDSCSGVQHGARIRGMEILLLRREADGIAYAGKVLDPEEGHSYNCVATFDDSGKHLSIRGYVGIPALGRSVLWTRIE
jgi:Uncharacterized protein conserved in bacteria (DUF2147)